MPGKKVRSTLLVCATLMLGACWSHSLPTSTGFIRPAPEDCVTPLGSDICGAPHVVQLFADMNGTLFPSGWKSRAEFRHLQKKDSLLFSTPQGSDARRLLDEEEGRQLAEIAKLGDGRGEGRIFILVHGYNNTVAEADAAYRAIESRLSLNPRDRIIRFYWDGRSGSGVGSARIWFYAAGDSQLVGSRALRNVLRQFADEDIYMIGHSRGTAVILSALGNPVYDPAYRRDTMRIGEQLGVPKLLEAEPLEERNNRIRILVAAPAVDRIDFCDASAQPPLDDPGFHCPREKLRPLGSQVQSFLYTVNTLDPILDKLVGLGGRFNPTGLGLKPGVGETLRQDGYDQLRPYRLSPEKSEHSFVWYAQHPTFARMLRDLDIGRDS